MIAALSKNISKKFNNNIIKRINSTTTKNSNKFEITFSDINTIFNKDIHYLQEQMKLTNSFVTKTTIIGMGIVGTIGSGMIYQINEQNKQFNKQFNELNNKINDNRLEQHSAKITYE